MQLPVNPPVLPMLAKRVDDFPPGNGWIFEPKWDGFRALVFRDGDEILIQSRDQKSLNRDFPELVETLLAQLPPRCVLDGEIVIATERGLDFELLQLRIHPQKPPEKAFVPTNAGVDCVLRFYFARGTATCAENRSRPGARNWKRCYGRRRPAGPHHAGGRADECRATDWFRRFEGAGLDGVIAKPIAGTYEPDKRVMLKIKHERDCDCVVAGFRWHKTGEPNVGSLLLGLFDDAGALQHVGVCASFTQQKRRELAEFLEPYRAGALVDHPWRGWAELGAGEQRMPGGQSRWSQGKDLSWEPVRVELVVEVAYEHMQGSRFGHMAQFRRWRTDKKPSECTYAQLEVVPPQELAEIFASGR